MYISIIIVLPEVIVSFFFKGGSPAIDEEYPGPAPAQEPQGPSGGYPSGPSQRPGGGFPGII